MGGIEQDCGENVTSRTNVYIYMVKYKDFPVLKIGWSTDPLKRCRKISGLEVESLVCVKMVGNRSNIMYVEAMFHRALYEYRQGRNKELPSWDGSTEYFSLKAWGKFYEICEVLRLNIKVLR